MAGSISGDGARAEIVENALVVGNPVKNALKIQALASLPMYADSSGQLAVGAIPFALPLAPSAATGAAVDVTGTVNGNIMTQTLVAAASATTFTSAGFIRVTIVSSQDGLLSTGAYYLQIGTLT